MFFLCTFAIFIVTFSINLLTGDFKTEKMLPNSTILATHTKSWSHIVQMRDTKSSAPFIADGTEAFFKKVPTPYVDKIMYYLFLKKKISDKGIIQFDEHLQSISATNCEIRMIDSLLPPSLIIHLQTVKLDNNNLHDFEEIQKKVFNWCPILKEFSACHNNFSGALTIEHQNLGFLDLSHNNFSSIHYAHLPNCSTINLHGNNLTSFKDFQNTVLKHSLNLKVLNAQHNKFLNEFSINHQMLEFLDLSYNHLSIIGNVYLPNCLVINLQSNNINSINFNNFCCNPDTLRDHIILNDNPIINPKLKKLDWLDEEDLKTLMENL